MHQHLASLLIGNHVPTKCKLQQCYFISII